MSEMTLDIQMEDSMSKRPSYRVLVVDDEPSVRQMLADFLEMNDIDCDQAENGESALFVTEQQRFDLIIMDVRMPGVDGIEALRRIKRLRPSQQVLMVSAVSDMETAVEAMRLGAHDYVMKPFVLQDMLKTIGKAIEDGARNSTAMASGREAGNQASDPEAWGHTDGDLRSIAHEVNRIFEDVKSLKERLDAALSVEAGGLNGGRKPHRLPEGPEAPAIGPFTGGDVA